MLKKQYIKSRQMSKVTFALPKAELPEGFEVESVNLVGEFNNWDYASTPMEPNSKGTFRATLKLEPKRTYQFRYLVNSEHWYNEWHADAYIPGGFGKDNCIVNTEVGE